jgi:thymidine kinase
MTSQNISQAYLELIDGPMRAGKSTYLLDRLTYEADIGHKVLFIQSERNVRSYVTHSSDNKKISSKIEAKIVTNLSSLDSEKYSVVGVDEGQFFDDLKDTVLRWMRSGKRVYVAGLTSTWDQKDFGQMIELRHYCHKYRKLLTVCVDCLKEAVEKGDPIPPPNAVATIPNAGVRIEGTIRIGGGETYKSVCFRHLMISS